MQSSLSDSFVFLSDVIFKGRIKATFVPQKEGNIIATFVSDGLQINKTPLVIPVAPAFYANFKDFPSM